MKKNNIKGCKDLSTKDVLKKNYIIKIIKKNFHSFGFQEIETSSIENLSILNYKYEQETDNLIFKIINSGISFSKNIIKYANINLSKTNNNKIINKLCKKGLRYDLTVPLVRYYKSNINNIELPFKVYQIGKVWRADKPQKGRLREFYQCDVDIINRFNRSSLWEEVELLMLYINIFIDLNIPITISINHRKLIENICEIYQIKEKNIINFIRILDKWEKIGREKVKNEMIQKNINTSYLDIILDTLDKKESNNIIINFLEDIFNKNKKNTTSLTELKFIFNNLTEIIKNKNINLKLNLKLARGLIYYDGVIFEINIQDNHKQSIAGGGRYNYLTKLFGLNNISGVGCSIGLSRIMELIKTSKMNYKNTSKIKNVLFLNYNNQHILKNYYLIHYLRNNKIPTEIYPKNIDIKKQMKYANKKKICFVIKIKNDKNLYIRNMQSGKEYIFTKKKQILDIIINQ